jgi:L-threonylcarbamoyladenylate synthase
MIVVDGHEARERAAQLIKAGGVVAFRTDTFYGLGADPFNREALAAIKSLKGRDDGKPILVVLGDPLQAERLIVRSALFDKFSARHWPGALTLVAEARDDVPVELTAGTGTVGVRLPDDDAARDFVLACGGALTATSANLAGGPPARQAQEVALAFPNGLALIVDGGEARSVQPSTVLDVSGAKPRLIREGVITKAELEIY